MTKYLGRCGSIRVQTFNEGAISKYFYSQVSFDGRYDLKSSASNEQLQETLYEELVAKRLNLM